MTDYSALLDTLRSLTGGICHPLANLSNAAALLWQEMERINWAGFYLMKGSDLLVLGPFQGKPACIEIPLGRGVCGTAASGGKTVVVPDVHEFPGHIACDSASQSEIVVPICKDDRVIGVLDIDSPEKGTFGEADRVGLEAFAAVIADLLPGDMSGCLL